MNWGSGLSETQVSDLRSAGLQPQIWLRSAGLRQADGSDSFKRTTSVPAPADITCKCHFWSQPFKLTTSLTAVILITNFQETHPAIVKGSFATRKESRDQIHTKTHQKYTTISITYIKTIRDYIRGQERFQQVNRFTWSKIFQLDQVKCPNQIKIKIFHIKPHSGETGLNWMGFLSASEGWNIPFPKRMRSKILACERSIGMLSGWVLSAPSCCKRDVSSLPNAPSKHPEVVWIGLRWRVWVYFKLIKIWTLSPT